jgi:phage baseplate assembly protein W
MSTYSDLPIGSVATGDVPVAPLQRLAGALLGGPRHLAHPLRLVDGPGGTTVFASLEQDTVEEVAQSVRLVLSTERGERYQDAPDFGVETLLTGASVDISAAQQAVATWEPRAKVDFTSAPVTADGQQVIRVDVSLVTGAADVTPSLDR